MAFKKESMWALRDITLVHPYTYTHILHKTLLCIHIHARKNAHMCRSPHTNIKSKQSGADQLFSCGGRSQLRHLKRTEHSAWCRLPLFCFFTLRRSISLMQSCRALASIKSNIYHRIKRGERTERDVMTYSGNGKMERFRENRKKKTRQTKTWKLLSRGGVRVTTGVTHLNNMHISLCEVCMSCVYKHWITTLYTSVRVCESMNAMFVRVILLGILSFNNYTAPPQQQQ